MKILKQTQYQILLNCEFKKYPLIKTNIMASLKVQLFHKIQIKKILLSIYLIHLWQKIITRMI